MRTQRPAPHVLVARDAATRPRVVGGLFIAAAAFLLTKAVGSVHQVDLEFGGALCVLIAIFIWRSVSAQVVTLDRGEGVVRVRTQHLLGTSSVVHRLVDVADVVLERRVVARGHEVFRPAFVMRNNTHQGWGMYTLHYARAEQIAAVRVMREFLGTAHSLTAPDGSVAIPRPTTAEERRGTKHAA
jgi:hypothetical protein